MKNISILRHYNQMIYSKILFRVMNKALEQRLHGFKLLWIISTLRVFWITYSCLGLFQGRKFFDFVTKVLLLFIESLLLKTESRCNVISCCAQSSQLMPLFVTTASELPEVSAWNTTKVYQQGQNRQFFSEKMASGNSEICIFSWGTDNTGCARPLP